MCRSKRWRAPGRKEDANRHGSNNAALGPPPIVGVMVGGPGETDQPVTGAGKLGGADSCAIGTPSFFEKLGR